MRAQEEAFHNFLELLKINRLGKIREGILLDVGNIIELQRMRVEQLDKLPILREAARERNLECLICLIDVLGLGGINRFLSGLKGSSLRLDFAVAKIQGHFAHATNGLLDLKACFVLIVSQ